jgi:exodeoxyribonuclease V beta subunit
LKNVASAAEARKNEAKKRSLHGVNEHFGVSQARLPEPNFDDASADSERRETSSAVVFQRAGTGEQEQDFAQLNEEGVALWPQAAAAVARVLGDPGLNGNKFQKKSVARWLLEISAYFSGELLLPPDGLAKISTDNLIQGVKKGCPPPHHPFCDYAGRFWSAWQELLAAFDREILALKTGLFAFAAAHVETGKEELRVLGFDDLLTRLRMGLAGSAGPRLAAGIRKKYPAALIDEFQDTDPIQFEIFSRIHADEKGHLLYLIGDPKQAIYNFRGADIFAYLEAARTVKSKYSLEDNYRSEPGLIRAINAVFAEKAGRPSFVFPEIVFTPANWPGRPGAGLVVDEGERAPLQVMLAAGDVDGKQLSSPDSRALATRACCAEICRLLQLAVHGRARIGERSLAPGDIAVLVRTNAEARQVQQALLDVGVASVVKFSADLFASHEAGELIAVLEAVAEPSADTKLVAALATDILGWSAWDLYKRGEDEAGWDALLGRFATYNRLWHDKGFMAMFEALVSGEEVRGRLLGLHDGERRITNLLHLGEALQARSGLASHHLIDYLKQGVAGRHAGEHEQRLESDALRLQIVTVHKAKGLQYPVVFCPFLWGGSKIVSRKAKEVFFHQERRDLVLDIGSPDFDVHREIALEEELAENLRLAYVALTRARNRCYVVWGPLYGSGQSALASLFHGRAGEGRVDLEQRLQGMDTDSLAQELAGLVERGGDAIALLACPPERGRVQLPPSSSPALACRSFTATVDRSWQVSSFSRLTAGLHQEAYVADHDRTVLAPELGTAGEGGGLTIFDFPRGAGPGTFLHHLLENLDFGDFRGGPSAQVREWLAAKLGQFGFEGTWNAALGRMLTAVVNVRLPGQDFCLADLGPDARLNELEFHLPLAPSRAGDLLAVFGRHRHGGGPDLAPRLARLDYTLVKGFLKGFIDLVFCHDHRFYIIDWKSNYLGSQGLDYGQERLQAAMVEADYVLQYHLYAVALHRYLAARLPAYDFQRHFGGVFYVFLRGVEQGSGNGIFFDRPAAALVAELADLLALPAAGTYGGEA